jgi:transposase
MMGHRSKQFKIFAAATLESLVPDDSFYRVLEGKLDLSFVRDLAREHYEEMGRPSIDPVVFFKLQLVLFFEGLRSERELVRVAADRLSVRWYLGYDLDDPLPDHSSLTRIRQRLGLATFDRFFERVIELCQEAGWSGAKSSLSMPPRCGRTPMLILWSRAFISRPSSISRSCSPRRERPYRRVTGPLPGKILGLGRYLQSIFAHSERRRKRLSHRRTRRAGNCSKSTASILRAPRPGVTGGRATS